MKDLVTELAEAFSAVNKDINKINILIENQSSEELNALLKEVKNKIGGHNFTRALLWSSNKQNNKLTLELLRAGADSNLSDFSATEINQFLALAAIDGQKELCEVLIKAGADVNYHDESDDYVPLAYAVQGGHKEIVELLLIKGADPNIKLHGKKAIDYAQNYELDLRQAMLGSFNICKKLYPLLSKEEIDYKDIDLLKQNFGKLTAEGQKEYISKLKLEKLKEIATEIQAGREPQIEKLTQKDKNRKLYGACITGDKKLVKYLLEMQANLSKEFDLSEISPEIKKFLRANGVKIKTENMKESDIIENIKSLKINELREVFNNVDPNKYKKEINEALDKTEDQEKRNEFVIFLCKKGFDPKNITEEQSKSFLKDFKNAELALVDDNKVKQTVKIIDDAISKTSASAKVNSHEIYKKMEKAGLVEKNITEEKQKQIIKKINKVTAEYNHQNRSHNFLKRAVRSLLHFVGVKYVGKKEAMAVLSKVNLSSSKKDKAGSIGR